VITGTNLDNTTSVKFHTTDATTFTADSSTQITATVPAGATTGKVTVTTSAGSAASAETFTVTGIAPTITSYTPTSGIAGTLVKIYGAGFTGASAVAFNGAAVTAFIVVSDNEIDANVPASATTGPISVTNSAGTAVSSGNFTVIVTPTITSFTPSSGVPGTEVTIQGTGFTGVTSVQFNVAANTFSVDSDTQLRATVPLTATTGPIAATNAAGTGISQTSFTVLAPVALPPFTPIADSYTNSSKPTSNFGNASSILAREGGGTTVTYKSYLKFVVSGLDGAPTSAVLRLFVNEGGAATVVSTTDNSWTETGITWDNAPAAGTLLGSSTPTATGAWIAIPLPPETLSAGNATYSFLVRTDKNDSISYSSRQGANPPQLVLTQSSDAAPTITSFTPASGPVGTVVVITGTNFQNVTAVKSGATAATVYSVDSATQISATVPTGTSTGKLSVTTSVGTATSAQTFTLIVAPTITSFTPASGIAGILVKTYGAGFTGASAVAFNGAAVAAFTVVSDNEIDANVPASATTGPISITNSAGTAVSSGNFTVIVTPAITSFTPTSGVPGTEVTIQGTGFTGVTSVQFNVAANTFSVDSDTQLRATVPLNATTGKIQLTNVAGTAISATDFTVTPASTLTFTPVADSYTQSTQPTKNFGNSAHVLARLGTATTVAYNTYLRFSVGGLAGIPTSAVLRLFVNDGGSASIVSACDNSWTEYGITWANAPAAGTFYGSATPTVTGTWVSVALPTSIFATGNTDYSFVITSNKSDTIDYSSRQGLYPPQLVLTQ
jgi:hypothetical protein